MLNPKKIVTTQGADGSWVAFDPTEAPTLMGYGATEAMAISLLQIADYTRIKSLRASGLPSPGAVTIWADVSKALESDGWTVADYQEPPNGAVLRSFTKGGVELSITWAPHGRASQTMINEVCSRTGLDPATIVPTGDPNVK